MGAISNRSRTGAFAKEWAVAYSTVLLAYWSQDLTGALAFSFKRTSKLLQQLMQF